MHNMPTEPVNFSKDKLVKALEDERYQWRTVDGLVTDLKMHRETIEELLAGMKQTVVRSSIPDDRGRSLYTTRRHYKRTHGFGDKVLAALSDRIVAADMDKVA